jgi:hypothetical protein
MTEQVKAKDGKRVRNNKNDIKLSQNICEYICMFACRGAYFNKEKCHLKRLTSTTVLKAKLENRRSINKYDVTNKKGDIAVDLIDNKKLYTNKSLNFDKVVKMLQN